MRICVCIPVSRATYISRFYKILLVFYHIMITVTQLLDRPSQKTDNQHPMVPVLLYFHYMDRHLYA